MKKLHSSAALTQAVRISLSLAGMLHMRPFLLTLASLVAFMHAVQLLASRPVVLNLCPYRAMAKLASCAALNDAIELSLSPFGVL